MTDAIRDADEFLARQDETVSTPSLVVTLVRRLRAELEACHGREAVLLEAHDGPFDVPPNEATRAICDVPDRELFSCGPPPKAAP